jgi:radical SAM protein with 4Fe4S-binding SPASM domain
MQQEIKNLIAWHKGKKPGPIEIELAPTLDCNLNCLFCWRQGSKYKRADELSLLDYKNIIDQATKLGVKSVKIIGGGEALFRKDMIELMLYLKKKNLSGYICTNGTLFNEDSIEQLVKSGWNHIKISLHGPNPKTNDYLVDRKGAFNNVLANIKQINDFKQKYKKNLPFVEIGYVLVNKNYKGILDMFELCRALKVDALFVEPITVYSKKGEKLRLSKKQINEFKEIAKNGSLLAKQYAIHTNLHSFVSEDLIEKTGQIDSSILKANQKGFLGVPCYEPWLRIGIRVNGDICPCGFFDTTTTENIKEKSLKEIWYGSYFTNLRKNMLSGNLPDHCRKCCTTLVMNNIYLRNEFEKCIKK